MVGVSASVNLPLHHKVQEFSSGTDSPGWSWKKGRKMVVVWWWCGKETFVISGMGFGCPFGHSGDSVSAVEEEYLM